MTSLCIKFIFKSQNPQLESEMTYSQSRKSTADLHSDLHHQILFLGSSEDWLAIQSPVTSPQQVPVPTSCKKIFSHPPYCMNFLIFLSDSTSIADKCFHSQKNQALHHHSSSELSANIHLVMISHNYKIVSTE